MSEWIIERLAAHHDRSSFDCGKPPLSEWIRQGAGQHERRDLARTYVAVRDGSPRILGYYAISSCHVGYELLPADRARGLPRHQGIPAALLGRLAVDKEAQGQGLGEALLIDALRRVEHLADQIGIRLVVVDAIDDQARGFYERYGFEAFLDNPRHLFMPVTAVRGMKLGPLEG